MGNIGTDHLKILAYRILWDIHQDGLMLSGLEVSNYASNRENEASHFYNLRMSKRERERCI